MNIGALVIAFLAGSLLSTLVLKFALKNISRRILTELSQPTKFVFKSGPISAFFPEIDQALLGYRKRIQHLIETIATLGEESQVLIERYELLTNNLAAAVIVRDNNGKISYVSPFCEVLTGYSRAEIYGSELDLDPELAETGSLDPSTKGQDFMLAISHPEDIEQLKRAFRVSATGEAFQYRHRFYHRSGIEMWAETRTVPVLGEDGSVITTLSITFDVTGTVRYQKQVEERNRDLQDFTYMVSHDLKAPLFTIQGMASLLKDENAATLNSTGQEALDHIIQASSRLQALIASILEYSKAGTSVTNREGVALNTVISEVIADHSEEIKRSSAIIEIDEEIGNVLGDRIKLYQVFSNLLGNALKYRSPERVPLIQVSKLKSINRRRVEILVSDNGLGIPEDKLSEVFRPFQRLNSADVEGSGVGLACVKRIVDKLGGEINVKSDISQGSKFHLVLPIDPSS